MHNRRNAIWLVIILLLLIGLFTGRTVFFNLAYLFGGLIVLSILWSWLAVRGIRIRRMTRTRRSQVGKNFVETFVVRNQSFIPKMWLEVRDYSDLPKHYASHVVPTLLPGGQYDWRVETPCTIRGEFQLGPIMVISGDPFGLFLTPRKINAIEKIIIYPFTFQIPQFRLPVGVISGGEAQRHMTQNITTDAAGVREYVPGDSISRVHWKSTARRNTLIVKEFELDPLVDIWVLLDLSLESRVEAGNIRRVGGTGAIMPDNILSEPIPPSTEEYGISIAASIVSHFVDAERAVGFITYAPERTVFQPDRGHRQLTRILETLAVAQSQQNMSLQKILALEAPRISRSANLIIITSSIDSIWVKELQAATRRGIRATCIHLDPSTFGFSPESDTIRSQLQLARIPVLAIRNGDNLPVALSQRPLR
jgi:uncharacterized protein (DUF58 family)